MGVNLKSLLLIVLACAVIITGVYYFVFYNPNADHLSFNQQETDMINITLRDNRITTLLDDLPYNVFEVNTTQQYVLINVGNKPDVGNVRVFSCLMSGVDLKNNSTTYIHHLSTFSKSDSKWNSGPEQVNIAMGNKTVTGYIDDQICDVEPGDLRQAGQSRHYLIFNLGTISNLTPSFITPGPSGALYVGVDIANNTITGIIYSLPTNWTNLSHNVENGTNTGEVNLTYFMKRDINEFIRLHNIYKVLGWDDARMIDEFSRMGVIYNPIKNEISITPQYPGYSLYNYTGPVAFSTYGDYLAGVSREHDEKIYPRVVQPS